MNALHELRDAVRGWLAMLGTRSDGASRFVNTLSGAINAVGVYVAMVLLTLLSQAIFVGAPTYSQIFFTLMVNSVPLIAVALVIWATLAVLRLTIGFNTLFVPAVYALSFVLLAGIPVSLLGSGTLSNMLLGILGYMLYRLARIAGKMAIGVSIAFAALSIVVLVALPLGLYMLTVPAPPAA